MDKENLYKLLDIEFPSDFKYFENLANYFESDEEIEYEIVAQLFQGVNKEVLAQLVDDYYEEITNFLPGGEMEIFTFMESVRKSLIGMCRNCQEDEFLEAKLIEELERFRRWYSIETKVYCTNLSTMEEQEQTLREALLLARIENLEGTCYQYDLSCCDYYPIDEYIMSFGDMIASEIEEEYEIVDEDPDLVEKMFWESL